MENQRNNNHFILGAVLLAIVAGVMFTLEQVRRPFGRARNSDAPPPDATPDAPPLPQTEPPKRHSKIIEIGFVVAFLVAVGVLLVAPRNIAGWLLLASLVPTVIAATVYTGRAAWRGVRVVYRTARDCAPQTVAPSTEGLLAVPHWVAAGELTAIVIVGAVVMTPYWQAQPDERLAGIEAEWLTSPAYLAVQGWQDNRYLPLWNPYNEKGEPLIDNPFSFMLNPFSMLPPLLTGDAERGILYSVVTYALLAGAGGWFLGYMLGMRSVGRLLLAAMMLGKGNMVAMVATGFFQLGVQQAYMPWILGAAVAIIRLPRARWPLVLFALGFALQFYAGNIWYTLPMLVSVGAVMLLWRYDGNYWAALRPVLQRFAVAGVLTLCLSAATLLPIFAKRGYIGGHKPLIDAGRTMPVEHVLYQFIATNLDTFYFATVPQGFDEQFHYSFVVTGWFLALIFIVMPPIYPLTSREGIAGGRRLWLVGLVLFAIFTVWGIGGLQPFRWMYNNLPGIARWRFVGRALGAASFWLAILVAMRADSLWTALTNADGQPYTLPNRLRVPLALLLLATTAGTMYHSVTTWNRFDGVYERTGVSAECAPWLREVQPYAPLSIYQLGYSQAGDFYNVQARLFPIEADYFAIPRAYTGNVNYLKDLYPPYAIPSEPKDRAFAGYTKGYQTITASPVHDTEIGLPCAMVKVDAIPYTFTVAEPQIVEVIYNPRVTSAARLVERLPDRVVVQAPPHPNEEQVVVVSEVAYPGWVAWVNGERAEITAAGGYLSVTLPPGDPQVWQTVRFSYRPVLFFWGAALTILAAVVAAGYLLRVDRLWRGSMNR